MAANNPFDTLRIFDFDKTISKENTLSRTKLSIYPELSICEIFEIGKESGSSKKKCSIDLVLKDKNINAIATFHNNHSYIAGFLSSIFTEDLLFDEEITDSINDLRNSESHAVAAYSLDEKTFLISYIPHSGKEYNNTVESLHYKNDQIAFLRQSLISLGDISIDTIVEFF